MSKRRFVLLDRDGTVIVKRHYLSDPEGVALAPNAAAGLLHMRQLGLGLILVTNQSGVGRNLFSIEQMHAVNERLQLLLLDQHVVLDDIYFCPHTPEDDCSCRKPRPGMVLQAAAQWDFDPREAFVIGDAACDIDLGKAVGAFTIYIEPNGEPNESDAPQEFMPINADARVADLAEAAAVIEQRLHIVKTHKAERPPSNAN
jgi:D-glycero-D-manno-heptose 1,7-bisphosphate phosphatase